MARMVLKFGGSSVRDAERIQNVAGIIEKSHRAGNELVVVVSAQGKTTDLLIAKAKELNPLPSRREMDMLLSSGEQVSIALLAMALEARGLPVKSLTGWQAGFVTDSNFSSARIRKIHTERIENELSQHTIVIVAGFQGINRYDDITTLGRGGSDTSAVALAASLKADACLIYTDVDGVYTADPRLVPGARKLSEISYDEMLELASMGAQVLHNRSVEMAKRYKVRLEVLSSLEEKTGTVIMEGTDVERMLIKGVAKDMNVVRCTVLDVPDLPGIAYKIFSVLSASRINVDLILQSTGRDGNKDISFTIARENKDEALRVLEEARENIGFEAVTCDEHIAKVSVVGAGIAANPGVASQMFGALADAGVNIQMISTSEIKISVLINRDDSDRAVAAIHNSFFPLL